MTIYEHLKIPSGDVDSYIVSVSCQVDGAELWDWEVIGKQVNKLIDSLIMDKYDMRGAYGKKCK